MKVISGLKKFKSLKGAIAYIKENYFSCGEKNKVRFILRDSSDDSELKEFKSLEDAVAYIKENCFISYIIKNAEDSLNKVYLKREGNVPLRFCDHVRDIAPLVKKYNLEPVDDLGDKAVNFATLHMEMPYLYVRTYDDKSITYGVRETVKKALNDQKFKG